MSMDDLVAKRAEASEFLKNQASGFEDGSTVAMVAVAIRRDGEVLVLQAIHSEDAGDAVNLSFWGEYTMSVLKSEIVAGLTKKD